MRFRVVSTDSFDFENHKAFTNRYLEVALCTTVTASTSPSRNHHHNFYPSGDEALPCCISHTDLQDHLTVLCPEASCGWPASVHTVLTSYHTQMGHWLSFHHCCLQLLTSISRDAEVVIQSTLGQPIRTEQLTNGPERSKTFWWRISTGPMHLFSVLLNFMVILCITIIWHKLFKYYIRIG